MKILLLSSRYEPYARGGAERVARSIARGVRDLGHEVVVATTAASGEMRDRVVDGIRVRGIPLVNIYGFDPPAEFLKPVWHAIDAFNPPMQAALERTLVEERPDVMHSHLISGFSSSAWSAARAAGVPIVHTLHDHYVLCARSSMAIGETACATRHFSCRILARPRFLGSRHVDRVVGVSQYVIARHRQLNAFEGVPASVIPNPCRMVGRTLQRLPSETLRMGFMGRLEPNKGIELLLKSLAGLEGDWSLRVAGAGDPRYVERLRSRYADRRVAFVGVVEPDAFLPEIDLMLVPSLFPETFGLSAAESLAVGIPVVVSNRGALPELVTPDATGFVFDADEPGALSSTLRTAVARRHSLAEMSARCRESVAHLAPALIAERYLALYATVARR